MNNLIQQITNNLFSVDEQKEHTFKHFILLSWWIYNMFLVQQWMLVDLIVPVLASVPSSAVPVCLCSYNQYTLTNIQNIVCLIITIKNTLHFTVHSGAESSKPFSMYVCVCYLHWVFSQVKHYEEDMTSYLCMCVWVCVAFDRSPFPACLVQYVYCCAFMWSVYI